RWTKYFSWKGKGDMPEKEKTQLRLYVQHAHDNGQLIRFWATPDTPGKEREAIWTELLEVGVDLINTDDLTGLRTFLCDYNALMSSRNLAMSSSPNPKMNTIQRIVKLITPEWSSAGVLGHSQWILSGFANWVITHDAVLMLWIHMKQ
ncbi:MAG: hypothetical protein KAS29_22755, partial [Bacteroidales bacterium]|nr:hypothetical protein [Bacteroidales bacterium]